MTGIKMPDSLAHALNSFQAGKHLGELLLVAVGKRPYALTKAISYLLLRRLDAIE